MHFKLLAVSTIAATAAAQSSSTAVTSATATSAAVTSAAVTSAAASGSVNELSVISILQTALPKSLASEAFADPAAFSQDVASEFSAGTTPSWFASLPTPIQSYLTQNGANVTGAVSSAIASANGTVAGNSSSGMLTTSTARNGHVTTHRVTHLTGGGAHTTGRHTGGGSGASSSAAGGGSGSGSSSSSSGGASIPTAIVGAGLAGVVGIVGLFAL